LVFPREGSKPGAWRTRELKGGPPKHRGTTIKGFFFLSSLFMRSPGTEGERKRAKRGETRDEETREGGGEERGRRGGGAAEKQGNGHDYVPTKTKDKAIHPRSARRTQPTREVTVFETPTQNDRPPKTTTRQQPPSGHTGKESDDNKEPQRRNETRDAK